jgi:hypothetical protein
VFVLPDVNMLVISAPDQASAVPAKDDMPDDDGIYMEARQQAGDYRAFCFDDAGNNAYRTFGKYDEGQQQNGEAGYG